MLGDQRRHKDVLGLVEHQRLRNLYVSGQYCVLLMHQTVIVTINNYGLHQ